MDKRITELAEQAIREKVFPGCVVAIVRVGERIILPYGELRYGGEDVQEDTMYDLASVSKSIPLSSLTHMLVKDGVLKHDDLVRSWIPELQFDRAATIEDLLRYRVYGPRMSELADRTPKEIAQAVFQTGFPELPGETRYSNAPAYLLGIILERATGKPLHECARERLFLPLAMANTFYPVGGHDQIARFGTIAPTEYLEGHEVCGIPHDESARTFARAHMSVGHAGLFSNAHDLSNFVESLLAGGYPEIVKSAHKGLGWEVNAGWFMGRIFGPRTFGKTGFTGTSVVCDTDRKIGIVILSNRTYPKRPDDSTAINAFRSGVHEAVFGTS